MPASEKKRELHLRARSRLGLLLAIPLAVTLLMLLIAFHASRRGDQVRHTLLVEITLERLQNALIDAETRERSYLLTGEDVYLRPYQSAVEETRAQLTTLDRLVSDNPSQKHTITRITPLVTNRLEQLESEIRQYHAGGFDLSTAKTGIDQGRRITSSIEALTEDMYQEEERLLRIRELRLSIATSLLYLSLALGYGLILLLVWSLYQDVKRYSQQTVAAQASLAQWNTELDQRVKERTALLHAREALLEIFLKYVPGAVAMFDREMHYLQASDRWCADHGVDRSQLLGRSHYEVFPHIPDRWKQIHLRCLAGEIMRTDEDRWDQPNGETIWLRWEVRPWGERDGLPEGILIFSEDITARKQIEERLRQSEATIRALLETAAQAILAIDSSGAIVIANRMVGTMFGYSSDELIGKQLEILIPEGIREQHRKHRSEFALKPQTRAMGSGMDLMGLRKDGSKFPIEANLSSVETNFGLLLVGVVSDITSRKKAETALRNSEEQLRALAGSLLTAQDHERRHLARELHDDVTQQLAFLSIELGKIAAAVPDTAESLRAQLRVLQSQTLLVSSEVRRLSHGLHPSIITDFGLSVALEEFCDEFESVQGVQINFAGLDNDSRLSDAAASCLYRIAQEGMRNAVVHGQATTIDVTLRFNNGSIQLQVKDNGVGFSPDTVRNKGSLGLVSMRERIRLVNGTLTLLSEPGQGTEIIAAIPIAGVSHETGTGSVR